MRRVFITVTALFFLFPLLSTAATQQASVGQNVTGTVLDPTKAPLHGAAVTATSTAGSTRTATTNERGEFTLSLDPGTYSITITFPGFTTFSQTLTVGGPSTPAEVVLNVEGLSETVNVVSATLYRITKITTATRMPVELRDVPQSVTVVTKDLIQDQLMSGMADVVRYVPGITAHQGENNRDDVVIRGNRSSADFFVNGVRDDVQYYRDLYNLERVEALKGPNAMIFGRGGGGGVVNRVVKEAQFQAMRSFTVQGGAYDNRRVTADVDQPLGGSAAFRINGVYEDTGSFRRGVGLERSGINPTFTFQPSPETKVILGYEHLRDERVADRGITSFQGRPATVARDTFYGNAGDSEVRARVNLGSSLIEHRTGQVTIRNRTVLAGYNRFYQNYVPGAATPDATLVTLTAYNNATDRTNLFNQTDVIYPVTVGGTRHTLLAGAELGRQLTDNFRQTGYFNDATTSVRVPFESPSTTTPVTYRQSGTDADNQVEARVAAAFVQDHVEISRRLQVLAGMRVDRFDLHYNNNRTGDSLDRGDTVVSPRAGVVLKPVDALSVYGSYSVSFLPSAGDQFSALTTITQQVKPERFVNYELGAKWDAPSSLSFTLALYRLDRTNTRATDPSDPARIIQTGSQRTEGIEAGVNGRVTSWWRVAGGAAWQDAFVTSATISARAGAKGAQVPRRTLSLWNNYQLHPRLAAGLGIVYRSDMFASIDNTVTLPGYTRVDAAAFLDLTRSLRLQVNAENLLDANYFANADSNTNISPGVPRSVRLALRARF